MEPTDKPNESKDDAIQDQSLIENNSIDDKIKKLKDSSIHSALKEFFDVQVRQKQRAAEAEYKKIKMVKAMMMGISDGISSMFSKQQFQSKNHDLLLKQGYMWHDKPEHYTDATGRVIS